VLRLAAENPSWGYRRRHADPADKADVYRELGVHLTYDHTERTVLAETRPTSSVCVMSDSEGDSTTTHTSSTNTKSW
jgi:hypothetical protein